MPLLCIETAIGKFEIELFSQQAPATCQYFVGVARRGELDAGQIFRVTHDEPNAKDTPGIDVVQLGTAQTLTEARQQLTHESTQQTGVQHKRWTVSASRFGPGELYASLFICMRDEPELDFGGNRHSDGQGYAAFGTVTSGTHLIKKIHQRAHHNELLKTPITIQRVSVATNHDS